MRRFLRLSIVLLVVAAARTAPASELETLREGGWLARAAADYLVAFAAGDEGGLRDYVTTYRDATSLARTPPDARVARQLRFGSMLGAIEIASIEEMSDTRVAVIVRSPATGGYFEIFVEASPEQEMRIGSQGMRPADAPGEEIDFDAATTLQGVVDALHASGDAPGAAMAIASVDGGIDIAVAGVRRLDRADPVVATDAFHVGSLTKSMTASIALRLAGRGELALDAPVRPLLEDMEVHGDFEDVTLADLLAHRAGLEPLTEDVPVREAAWRAAGDDPRDQRQALVRDVLSKRAASPPRAGFAYSNAGYVVAAVVMERVTGSAWEDLVREHVFEALELESAHTGWPWLHAAPSTRGHRLDDEELVVQAETGYSLAGPLAPAGDVSMDVEDLARYGVAHLRALAGDDSWLNPELVARAHRPLDDAAVGYAFGWSIERMGDHVVHQHAGSAGTYFALLAICPATGTSIAIAVNAGDLGLQAALMRSVEWALEG